MAYGRRVLSEPLRSLGFASIGPTFTAIGADPNFNSPIRIISIKNLTNESVIFSFDGLNEHEILAAQSALVLDLTANRIGAPYGIFMAQNTIVYAKEGPDGPPASGNVYVSVYYVQGD